jgi:hypothetical protein
VEVLEFQPRVGRTVRLPWEPFRLIPLGDIQAGIASCDLDLLDRTVQRGLAAGAWFIGMGDYLDVMSPSNRRAWAASQFYDSVREAMDSHMRRQEQDLLKILGPTRSRWLGMLEGHHTYEYEDGSTTDINLCNALNAKFLGHSTLMRLVFGDRHGHKLAWKIFAHHGIGSGQSVGSPLLKLEKVLEWAEADLYLMGHQHKRVAGHVPRFYLTEAADPELITRERLLVGTGSYLKGYMKGSISRGRPGGTYVEQAMMRPVSLGSPIIECIPERKGDSYLVRFEATV